MKLKSLLTLLAALLLIVPGKAQTFQKLDVGKSQLVRDLANSQARWRLSTVATAQSVTGMSL